MAIHHRCKVTSPSQSGWLLVVPTPPRIANDTERLPHIQSRLCLRGELRPALVPRGALGLRDDWSLAIQGAITHEHREVAFDSEVVVDAREQVAAETCRAVFLVESEERREA